MKNAMGNLRQALWLSGQMDVSDKNVDLLALVRQEIRVAYTLLEKAAEEAEKEVTEDGNDDRQTAEDAK